MKIRTLSLCFASAVIIMMAGCGDDSTPMREGDPDNTAFITAKANLDSSMAEFNDDLIEAVDSLFTFNGFHKFSSPDTIEYDSTEGWHIRRWIHYMDDFLLISVIDSFRFIDSNGEYQRHRSETTSEFERRLRREISYTSGSEDGGIWEKVCNRNMRWTGLTDSHTYLTGDIYRHYAGSLFLRQFEHTVEGEFRDVTFQTSDIMDGRPTYPIDGTFGGTFITDRQLAGGDIHIEGEFTVTFYFDHYHVHLVANDRYWDWDVYHFFSDN